MTAKRISAIFSDVFDLGRTAGFSLGFRQLDSGPESVQADLRIGGRVMLARMKFDRAYHQCGLPPAGMKSFGIPFRGMRSWLGNGYETHSVLPFNLPGGIDGVSESGFEACTMSVSEESLHDIGKTFQVPIGEALVSPCTNTVIGNGRATRLYRRLVTSSFEQADRRFDPEYEAEIILALLRSALADAEQVDKSSSAGRARAVSKAMACINDHRDEPVTVAEICRETGIPLRTLNRAFRERFGVGPKAYLIRKRLSDVRTELIGAPPDTLITDVANRRGFWHMGQFAKDYRSVFGELPSETLTSGRI